MCTLTQIKPAKLLQKNEMYKKNAKNRKKKQLFYVILHFLWTFAQLCERYFGGNPPRRGRGVPKYNFIL